MAGLFLPARPALRGGGPVSGFSGEAPEVWKRHHLHSRSLRQARSGGTFWKIRNLAPASRVTLMGHLSSLHGVTAQAFTCRCPADGCKVTRACTADSGVLVCAVGAKECAEARICKTTSAECSTPNHRHLPAKVRWKTGFSPKFARK